MCAAAGTEIPPEEAVIPDLTGLSYSQARDALGSLGLFLRSDSTILADSDTVRVAFQDIPPGTGAERGTVVEVTLCNADDEIYGKY